MRNDIIKLQERQCRLFWIISKEKRKEETTMKKFKKIMAAGLTVIMCVGLLAGCGSSKEESSNNGSSTGSGTKDVVTVGVNSDWNDISPFGTMSNARSATMYNFYEFMAIRKDFGAELDDMVLECAKEINKIDDLTYDVVMYDYIKDSEGNAITAADYAWAAMAMKDAGNYEKLSSYLESVTAIDDYTAEIKLSDNPLGTIEYVLNIVPVISQAAYEASSDGMATKPVTTGPYIVEELVPGSTLTLVKNEDYWQTEESAKSEMAQQNVDKIVYKVVTEASQMATALQTGDIDFAQYMDTTAIDTFYANGQATAGYEVYQLNSNMMFTVLPNMSENSILSNSVALREAIYYAIDAEAIVKAACGGYGSRLYAMANPLSADYDETWDGREYYEYNIETAKAKLEESGVDLSGTTLTILTQPAMNIDKVAEVIQAELEEIGIKAKILSVEDALYQTYKLDPKQFDLIIDIKGTDDFVTFPWSLLFDNRSFDGVTANFIADDELQKRLEACLSPDTHSQETVDAVESYLEENAYCYGLYTTSNYIVAKEGLFSNIEYLQDAFVLPGCSSY